MALDPEEDMQQVIYQQAVESTEDLIKKWPGLARVISVDHVKASASFNRLKGFESFASDKETATEVLDLYNAVIADGRFVSLLEIDPAQAAKNLGKNLRQEGVDLLKTALAVNDDGGLMAVSRGRVVVAVVIV